MSAFAQRLRRGWSARIDRVLLSAAIALPFTALIVLLVSWLARPAALWLVLFAAAVQLLLNFWIAGRRPRD